MSKSKPAEAARSAGPTQQQKFSAPAPKPSAEKSEISDETEESTSDVNVKSASKSKAYRKKGDVEAGEDGDGPKQKRRSRGNNEQVTIANPCCCDCALHEGVGWIAAVEFSWGLCTAIACLSSIITASSAQKRLDSKLSADEREDKAWANFGSEHNSALIAALVLHLLEALCSVFLMFAAARRVRSFCFIWIACIVAIGVAELTVVIMDAFMATLLLVVMNILRIYFVYVVYCLAYEILIFPQGPPITIYIQQEEPIVISTPVVYRAPAYYHPYYGYGYGPAYYSNADAAIVGAAAGVAIGSHMAYHDHYDYYW